MIKKQQTLPLTSTVVFVLSRCSHNDRPYSKVHFLSPAHRIGNRRRHWSKQACCPGSSSSVPSSGLSGSLPREPWGQKWWISLTSSTRTPSIHLLRKTSPSTCTTGNLKTEFGETFLIRSCFFGGAVQDHRFLFRKLCHQRILHKTIKT